MDFSSFRVLPPVLSDVACFGLMPEMAKGSVNISSLYLLHQNKCKFKFYLCVCTPGTENMHVSLLSTRSNIIPVCITCSCIYFIYSSKIGHAGEHALFWKASYRQINRFCIFYSFHKIRVETGSYLTNQRLLSCGYLLLLYLHLMT